MFVQQNAKGKVSFFGARLYIPTSIIIGNDLAIQFQHQLADFSTVDTELAAFLINLNPVVDCLVTAVLLRDADCSFFPHSQSSISPVRMKWVYSFRCSSRYTTNS